MYVCLTQYPFTFQVDPIGPLATLKNLFLSDKSLSVVKEFMDRYWYMIVLCLIIVILSLVSKTPFEM